MDYKLYGQTNFVRMLLVLQQSIYLLQKINFVIFYFISLVVDLKNFLERLSKKCRVRYQETIAFERQIMNSLAPSQGSLTSLDIVTDPADLMSSLYQIQNATEKWVSANRRERNAFLKTLVTLNNLVFTELEGFKILSQLILLQKTEFFTQPD